MKSKFLIALLVLNFVQAIFSSAKASEVLKFEAQYIIPTQTTHEISFSTYDLQDYQIEIFSDEENKPTKLTYVLPAEMVGQETEVSFDVISKRDGEKYLVCDKATAKCIGPWSQLKCEMRFHQLSVNLSAVESLLRQNGANEEEINTRLKVLSRFSGDPIGFTQTK
jgi:hypothetical protein